MSIFQSIHALYFTHRCKRKESINVLFLTDGSPSLFLQTSRTENDFMIDNDLNEKCFHDEKSDLIDENLSKIDYYLNNIPSSSFAKVGCFDFDEKNCFKFKFFIL